MRNYVPRQGETWKHFKGGEYEIIDLAKDVSRSSRDVLGVVYRSSDGAIYFRRIQNFMSTVDRDEKVIYRFERC